MGNNKIIGAKIKSIRESKQLSTQEVSERSGLSIEQIERIEGNIDFSVSRPANQDSPRIRRTPGHIPGRSVRTGPRHLPQER